MGYCPKCGRKTNPDARYCPDCGSPVNNENMETIRVETERIETEEIPNESSIGKENEFGQTNEDDESIWQSVMAFLKEIVQLLRETGSDLFQSLNDYIKMVPNKPKDSDCPYCGSVDTYAIVKNDVEVKTKGYSWGSGICGMCLLGPFGLLCGLCGSGSKVNSNSTTWWGCKNCGKQHLSQHNAIEMMDSFMNKLVVNCLCYGAVGSLLLHPMLNEFIHGILFTIVVALISIIAGVSIPLFLVYKSLDNVETQLGYGMDAILEVKKKKEYWDNIKISMLSLGGTLAFAYPILMFLAE